MSSQPPGLIRWLLVAQCTIAEAVGLRLTMRDWGAPTEEGDEQDDTGYFVGGAAPVRGSTPASMPPAMRAPPVGESLGGAPPPQYGGGAPPPPQYGADRMAHEDSMAGALAARARNEGTFSLGGEGWGTPEPMAPPRARAPHGDGYRYDERQNEGRPTTAGSIASSEADRIRRKNQGSFSFG